MANRTIRRRVSRQGPRGSSNARGAVATDDQKLNIPNWNTSVRNGFAVGLLQGDSPITNHSKSRPIEP